MSRVHFVAFEQKELIETKQGESNGQRSNEIQQRKAQAKG